MEKNIKKTANIQNPEWPKHEKIYDLCIEKAKQHAGYNATQWIHLADAVELGTISPLEAYDTLKLGYISEILKVRKSKYNHLL